LQNKNCKFEQHWAASIFNLQFSICNFQFPVVGDSMVPLAWYLGLSALLFTIGAVGVFIKRNAITIFLCIELMLNAVNLTLVSLSGFFGDVGGQLFVFIVMTVAAAEAAVGLAIIISIFRNRESLNVDEVDSLKL